jgi:hypothetical protein
MSSEDTLDPDMVQQVERCFRYAQTCLEIAERLSPGDDQRLILEMAEAWADFGAILMGSQEEAGPPRTN